MVKSAITIIAAMRYFVAMIRIVSSLAVLGSSLALGLALAGAPASARALAGSSVADAFPAKRFGGPVAIVTVTARIVRASASIGRDHGPPAPRMKPRQATVTAADGRSVAALVYDFE